MKRRHSQVWGYGEEDGPSTWPAKFPKAGGTRQSPVDIRPKEAVFQSWPGCSKVKVKVNAKVKAKDKAKDKVKVKDGKAKDGKTKDDDNDDDDDGDDGDGDDGAASSSSSSSGEKDPGSDRDSDLERDRDLDLEAVPPLTISYRPEDALKLGNTGHSVKADCLQKESTVTGGPLGSDVYRLAQFHLHWGAENDRGSEHTIDGKAYAAEIHLVHWNSTKYKNFESACTESDGLAVLCVLVKIDDEHKDFDVIIQRLKDVTYKDDTCTLSDHDPFDPTCLLPENTERFWTYPGSLTTPPCHESVQFIIFEELTQFSQKQIDELRSLKTGGKGSACMRDNFRPTCDLGDRTVLASFKS